MIRALSGSPNIPQRTGYAATSQAYVKGQLLYRDTTNGVLIPATGAGTTDQTVNIEGIAIKTFTAASSGNPTIDYEPILPQNLYVIDCHSTTNVNQIHKNHEMFDSLNLDNTSSSVSAPDAVFVATALGPSTTQLIGYFVKVGGVTA